MASEFAALLEEPPKEESEFAALLEPDQPVAAPTFNPRNEQISTAPTVTGELAAGNFGNAALVGAGSLSRTLEKLFAPGQESGARLISPEVADVAVKTASLSNPVGIMSRLLGGQTRDMVKAGEESLAANLSGVSSLEGVASLPTFAFKPAALAFAASVAAKLPEQYGRLKETIEKNGLVSAETARVAADAGIQDLMGFLALKGGAKGKELIQPETPQTLSEALKPILEPAEAKPPIPPRTAEEVMQLSEVPPRNRNAPVEGEGGTAVAQGDIDMLRRSNAERLGLPTEDLPPALPNAPEAVPTAFDFTPALRTTEGVIPGEFGKTHADIYAAAEDPIMLRANDPEHGFLDRNGNFKTRDEVSQALGETVPMQSERLIELQKASPNETISSTEGAATVGTEPAASETLGQGDQPLAPAPVESAVAQPTGAAVNEPAPTNDWITSTLPKLESEPVPAEPASVQALGIVPPGVAKLASLQSSLGTALKGAAGAVKNIANFSDFRKSVLKWSANNQKATGEVFQATKDLQKSIPDVSRREGITNWIQAGGDIAELQKRATSTNNSALKRGYEAAQNLTPDEIALAGKVRQTYDTLLKRAQAYGIEINELPDYVNQIWRKQPIKEFFASSNRKLSTSIRFAKERYYDSFFHGEQAGLKPETKDISKLLPIYMNEVNNAINAKQFVAEMAKGKASDGRPLLAPTGMVKTLENAEGQTHLVLPEMKTAETADYKALDGHPALRSWRWRAQDEAGNPILVQGDLRIHPEAYDHLKNILGQSAIREWYKSANENPLGAIPKQAVKFLVDDVNQVAKATMLGFLSPFHQVQEGTHAIGHRVNPFSDIPKIDFSKADQLDAAQHGLMLLPDRVSANQFREGLDGSKRNIVANLIGKAGKPGEIIKGWADRYQEFLFHEYIPGLKLKTYEHILPRNMERFNAELTSGEVSPAQVKYLSAQQANAAYGHLNYADIGRNPTMQHLLQTFLLAPDFLEARGRFTGQALKPSKAGREQLAALATLAVTQFVVSRILNKTLDDDYHWDSPFDVIVGNRRYGMRSVPADIGHAFSNTRQFVSGRLSPFVGRGLLEGLSGVNYRREPTTLGETLQNIVMGMIPLTLQPATRGLSVTGRDNPVSPMEQFLGSMGLHVSRFSPVSKIYSMAGDWVKDNGKDYGIDRREAVFPVSKYQQLRYALEDSNYEKAGDEYRKLMTDQKIDPRELDKRFKMAIFHPFTGSKKTDEIFRDSLDEGDRKAFNDAVERRDTLWRRYQSLR